MTFRVIGLDPTPFAHLFDLADDELPAHHARRVRVGPEGGVPDRVELRDLVAGETALLVHYLHQPAATPYRASHAVYVLQGARTPRTVEGRLPAVLRRRLLSLRAFDADDMMVDADVVEGVAAHACVERLLADARVAYVHAHYARPGCFAARIERA